MNNWQVIKNHYKKTTYLSLNNAAEDSRKRSVSLLQTKLKVWITSLKVHQKLTQKVDFRLSTLIGNQPFDKLEYTHLIDITNYCRWKIYLG